MSGRKHYTMRERASQITFVSKKIIELGGWILLKKNIGERSFVLYIAAELGCKQAKAKEYISMAVDGAVARAKVNEFIDSKKGNA